MKATKGYNIHVESPRMLNGKDDAEHAEVELGNASFISNILHRHAQNLMSRTMMMFRTDSPYYKHNTKKSIVLLRKKLLEISIEEHIASGSDESDEYYDDRAADLTELTMSSDKIMNDTLNGYFTEWNYSDPVTLARIASTLYETKIIGIAIQHYMMIQDAFSHKDRKKLALYWIKSLNEAYRLLIVVLVNIMGNMKHDVDCVIDFGNHVCDDINVSGVPRIKDCISNFMDEIMDRKIWKVMAEREHEQLGDDACMFESEFK